jgi:MFS family permease
MLEPVPCNEAPGLPSGRRWPAVLASFSVLSIAFSSGLFSLPVFYPALTRNFGWTRTAVAAGGSLVLLLIGITGPLVGRLVDRYSPKAVLLAGTAMSACALALLSTTASLTEFYVFCVVLGVATAAVSLVPTSMLIASAFSTRRGSAVGLINAGVGLGGFVTPVLAGALIDRHGAPQAFLWLAVFPLIPLVMTAMLVPSSLARSKRVLVADEAGRAHIPNTRHFRMLALSLFFAAHSLTGIQQHLVLYLTGRGVGVGEARLALSVLLGASAFGKLIGGGLADRYSSRVSLILSTVCLMLAIAGLLTADPGAVAIYGIVAVFGLGYGGVFNAPSICAFEYFGTRHVGTILGVLMMSFGLGTSSGGLVSGFLFDRTHSYSVSFAVDLAAAGVAGLLVFFLPAWPAAARTVVRSSSVKEVHAVNNLARDW